VATYGGSWGDCRDAEARAFRARLDGTSGRSAPAPEVGTAPPSGLAGTRPDPALGNRGASSHHATQGSRCRRACPDREA